MDLVVCGSVAVNRSGVRLGKGGGYADLELALLVEPGLVSNQNRDRDDGACVAGGGCASARVRPGDARLPVRKFLPSSRELVAG